MNEIEILRNNLEKAGSEKGRQASLRFFKEAIKSYGIFSKDLKVISSDFYQSIKAKSKEDKFEICDQLWQSGMLEESFIACSVSHKLENEYELSDFVIFERWVKEYINNWASCDTFCNHTIGSFMMKFPEYLPKLLEWSKSDNRWVKRASAVSLIVPARKGLFSDTIFQIADTLLLDKDDMVQKGYGWMLKVYSQFDLQSVNSYITKHKEVMPRTAFRYAIEKFPPELRKLAMQKS